MDCESSQMEPELEQPNPVGVGTSAAGNTGNGINMQRNEMPGCSKTSIYNDDGTQQVPLEQVTPTPINNMSAHEPNYPIGTIGHLLICSGIIAPASGTRHSAGGNGVAGKWKKKWSRPTSPPLQGRLLKNSREIRECWLAQLCSFPGISRTKAVAIVKKYPGPKELFEAYSSCSDKMGRDLLADIEYIVGWGAYARRETLGYLRSRTVYNLFYTSVIEME